ncbi:hypothetical protein ACFMBG_10475 [Leisingera sp. D0M16]|uniref:hypothetical protein n=1 Tax=Leisingera coralii TaxID=3351347 RepID=UPI003B806CA9
MDGSNFNEVTPADQIIDYLKDQANTILSSALGSSKLQGFAVTSLGNMPYVWQDPSTLKFNTQTYTWIKSNLRSSTVPYQFDPGTDFTNQYLNTASKIGWSLSSGDQAKLNAAAANATQQQAAVLNTWQSQMGELPPGKQPIDGIAEIITTEWADPPTTLTALQNSINPDQLLNKVPASGGPVVPVFMNWINALGAAVPLQNQITMNNAYLKRAIQAIQQPSETNGGLTLNDGSVEPAYAVSTPVADIENALKNASNKIELSMDVKRATSDEFQVSISGGGGFSVPVFDFLTLDVGGSSSYFSSDIATTSNETTVNMTFTGVNLVNYGPPAFSQAGQTKYWFWMDPVNEAIKNGYPAKDVSAFKFVSQPPVSDWGDSGPFGYLAGAAISNYPSIEIVVKSSSYQQIEKTFQQSASVGISFFGIRLGGGKEGSYSHSVTTDSSSSTVKITLTPPASMVAGTVVDSRGWVLGVQPIFPASKA